MRVAIVAYDGARLFDLAVAREVWRDDRLPVECVTCSPARRAVRVGGMTVAGDEPLTWAQRADLVVLPGADDPARFAAPDRAISAVLRTLRMAHLSGAVVAALCGGAFGLAAAGLLDGRPATTHWSLAAALAERFPAVHVRPEELFIHSERVWTSAGTAAGIDLCLALVREYVGPVAAAETSRRLVAAPFRRGDQAQFIERPLAQDDERFSLLARVAEIVAGEGVRWTVGALARRLNVSERTLVRRFREESGDTVHQWLTERRIEQARDLLVTSSMPIGVIAHQCGYSTPVTFRQRFRAEVGMSPQDYRAAHRGDDS